MSKIMTNSPANAKPVLFENARIIDPAGEKDEIGGLLMAGGKILAAGANAHNQGAPEGTEIRNLDGLAIIPGLIDTRCFIGAADSLAEENLETTRSAAAAGGVTSLIAIGEKRGKNCDNPAEIKTLRDSNKENNGAVIYPAGALTKGMAGQELAEFGLMKAAGAIALADGQETHRSSAVLRRAFLYAKNCGLPVIMETQNADLSRHAVATESFKADIMGLPSAPAEAETIALARDLELAHMTGVRYHAAHISTARAAALIKRAKAKGLPVSAAASINSISLNEQDIGNYDSAYRLFPPLRSEEDRKALIEALRDGTIDCITSCHQPRCDDAKLRPFAEAAAGAVGLESLLPAALRLYHNDEISIMRLVQALSVKPAQLFGIKGGSLQKNTDADFVILDIDRVWQFDRNKLHSACKNTAFDKARFEGAILETYKNGRRIYRNAAF